MNDGLIYNQSIIGYKLNDDWVVSEFISKSDIDTGGCYSLCYKVERSNQIGFMKVYDLETYLKKDKNSDPANTQLRLLRHFVYERELHSICKNGFFDKVCYAIGAGSMNIEIIPGLSIKAYYLIFQKADNDVNTKIHGVFNNDSDVGWKFKMLHNIATGMKQLYSANIYHQDIKPSNVLCFPQDEYKIGDLGRSYTEIEECPFSSEPYWGDKRYMAPEISYKVSLPDLNFRAKMTDLYLFGSLIYQMFSGECYNATLYNNLNKFLPSGQDVEYSQILPILTEIHIGNMNDFESNLRFDKYINNKIVKCVSCLCNPDYNKRRHPDFTGKNYQHMPNLERLISTFQHLYERYNLSK